MPDYVALAFKLVNVQTHPGTCRHDSMTVLYPGSYMSESKEA